MQKNSGNFSMEDAQAFAQSPAGQQLLALLQSTDNSALRQAMEQASAGDLTKARDILTPLLSSPEVRKLMQQFGGSRDG